jgi:HemY protein
MRRFLFVFATAILLGAFLISIISKDSGYVLIAFGNTSIETSLWFALLILMAAAYVYVLLVRLMAFLKFSWRNRKINRQKNLTSKGWLAFSKGQWKEAMNSLLKAAPAEGASFANYLMAARAANEMGNWDKAELILAKAEESDPKAKVAIDLTRAELLMQNREWQQARRLLEILKRESPRHRLLLSMLRTVYTELRLWPELRSLISDLRQAKIFNEEQLAHMEREVLEHILLDAALDTDKNIHPLQKLQVSWAALPKASRQNPLVFLAYVKGLAGFGADDVVEGLIRQQLKDGWSDELVLLYGRVGGPDPMRQLGVAEIWLKTRPNDSALLLTLGRLSLRNRQWEKAKYYFEACLQLGDNNEANLELGRLLVALKETERGRKLLEKGFSGGHILPALPLP